MLKKPFMSRPNFDSQELQENFDLNKLNISGWYAAKGLVKNGPENCDIYNVFVMAPRPDKYITQIAYGCLYQWLYPWLDPINSHEERVEEGIVKNVDNNQMFYTNKRVVTDFVDENSDYSELDGIPDTKTETIVVFLDDDVEHKRPINILRVKVGDESDDNPDSDNPNPDQPAIISNLGATLDNDTDSINISYPVHPSEDASDGLSNNDSTNDDSSDNDATNDDSTNDDLSDNTDDTTNTSDSTNTTNSTNIDKSYFLPEEHIPVKEILSRNVVFYRSYIDGNWTDWLSMSAATTASYIDTEKLYSYIDKRIGFQSSNNTQVSGIRFNISGTYQTN